MNSYSEIYIMLVWGVKYRLGLIEPSWCDKLYSVIGQLCKDIDCYPKAIGGIYDHIHVVISLGNDAPSIKDIVKYLKSNSSKWINDNRLCVGKFGWQEGCARFSYDKKRLPVLINYVNHQGEHHLKMTYKEELLKFYDRLDVNYNPQYIVKELE